MNWPKKKSCVEMIKVNENHKITEYNFFHHMLCTNVIQNIMA